MTLPLRNADTVYYPGRNVEGLSASELFVMAAVRLWVAEQTPSRPECADWPDWRRGMEVAGLTDDAIAIFDRIMRMIGTCARHPLKVQPPPCGRLGMGEAFLLDCIKAAQIEAFGALHDALAQALCPTGARLVTGPLIRFAEALREVGLVLPARVACRPVSLSAPADRGRSLLH